MRCWIRAWRHSQYTRIKYLLWNNADLYNSRHVFFIFLWVDYMTLFFFTPPPPHPAPLTSNHRSGGQRNRGSERSQRDPGSGQICWHMHGLFGKGRTLNQHGTNRCQLCWTDKQNDVGAINAICQCWANNTSNKMPTMNQQMTATVTLSGNYMRWTHNHNFSSSCVCLCLNFLRLIYYL